MRYRIKQGCRFARFENGKRVDYRAGSEIELTERELVSLRGIVEPATEAPVPKSEPRSGPGAGTLFRTTLAEPGSKPVDPVDPPTDEELGVDTPSSPHAAEDGDPDFVPAPHLRRRRH